MHSELFAAGETVEGCALFLGQHISLRRLRHLTQLASSPLTIVAGRGAAVVSRYGVIVFFGLKPDEIDCFITDIRDTITNILEQPTKEEFELFIDVNLPEGPDENRICLHSYNILRIQLLADVLAKSTVLSHYESILTEHFDRIEPLAESLRHGNHRGPKGRDLLKHIGETLAIEAKMTGRIEITEKPELIWDYPEHERLFQRLADGFELTERHAAIDRKLGLISKTAQTLLDLIHNERSLRVEWYIVLLIIADIIIAFLEKFI